MNEQEFLILLDKAAEDEGTTREAILERMHKFAELMDTSLWPSGRLAYVERLIREGNLGPNQADLLIRNNHILQQEIAEIADDVKRELQQEYGLAIPDYCIQWVPYLNPRDHNVGIGAADWRDRTLTFPTQGVIQLPIIIAHEHAHAYHMEHSEIFRSLKAAYNPGDTAHYEQIRQQARYIIEGWATFVSGLYARLRDARIGCCMYEQHYKEINGFMHVLDAMNNTNSSQYYRGAEIFEKIYARDGFDAAKTAANTLVTDKRLMQLQ